MSGLGTSSSQQSQSSQTSPWAPAQPALQGILSGINGQVGNYQANGAQTAALGQLSQNATNQQNYGGQINSMAGSYLGGDPTGLLKPGLQQYQQQLGGIANQNNNPMQTPGMQGVLNTINQDTQNSVNQQFAGAGRDMSGMNQQALARGISQGDSAALLRQYNQNVANQTGAAGNLYNAAGQTAGAITGTQGQGASYAAAAPTYQNAPAAAQLQAQQAAYGLPLNNLGMLENLTVPIAGLGGQSSGQSQGTYTASPLQQMSSIGGLFSGGGNSAMSGLGSLGSGVLGMFGGF